MRLVKPAWVSHDGFPIFSLDIHPDGSRFATGGQGTGDSGRVVIWNLAPVIDESQEAKENVPKMLSRMDNHLNCVNCVRWSKDGKYLASAGDDKVIMIWQIARQYFNSSSGQHQSSVFGPLNVESWRCVATLRGHSGDILDLNWSHTDPWLASCSVDNTIIIWNSLKWNDIVVTLEGHTGLVKGVSFDPIGKYIASQSDDKTLRVWRTLDWKEETVITEPFIECGGTTHVLRLSWSPDGQHLVSAHAMNNAGSVAKIIEREGWKTERDFVGHRKAVVCVRFSPQLLKRTFKSKKKEKEYNFSCVAIGSRDRSISIWPTYASRPITVLHELFSNSVMDISWTKDGHHLLACSWDGTVACLEFKQEELGIMLSESEALMYLEKLYGRLSISKTNSASNHNHNLLAEDVAFIRARDDVAAKNSSQTPKANGHVPHYVHQSQPSTSNHIHETSNDQRHSNDGSHSRSSSTSSPRMAKGPTDKQIEVKLSSGKRRITPLYIPPPTDLDGIPVPYNTREISFSTSVEAKSKIAIEKRDSNLSPAKDSNSMPSTSTPTARERVITEDQQQSTPSHGSSLPATQHKQASVGRPRSTSLTESKSPPKTNKSSTLTSTQSTAETPQPQPQSLSSNKRKLESQNSSSTSTLPLKKKPGRPPAATTAPKVTPQQQNATPSSITPLQATPLSAIPSKSIPQEGKRSRVSLAPLSLEGRIFTLPILTSSRLLRNRVVEVENNLPGSNGKLSALRLRSADSCGSSSFSLGGTRDWEVILTTPATGVSASESIVGVSCQDNTISVFSTATGRRLHPPFVVQSPIATITAKDYHLMVITTEGRISVWDFAHHRCLVRNESVAPLLVDKSSSSNSQSSHSKIKVQQSSKNGPHSECLTITHASLNSNGTPMVCISNRKSYVYDVKFRNWSLIGDSSSTDLSGLLTDVVKYPSSHQNELNDNPLSMIQNIHKSCRSSGASISRPDLGPGIQSNATISFLDQQLASAFVVGSSQEYKYWLLSLTQALTNEGREERLKELCTYLLGPVFTDASETSWENEILGLKKRSLLKDALSIMTSNLRLQRLFSEFHEQLSIVEASELTRSNTSALNGHIEVTTPSPTTSPNSSFVVQRNHSYASGVHDKTDNLTNISGKEEERKKEETMNVS